MYYALIDCNNFYVSCERVFAPSLNFRPVVVLSNNDGCIISRSNSIKKLNIPVGLPLFKCKDALKVHNCAIKSSNFALYDSMSTRVMSIIATEFPDIDVYSIDEAFIKIESSSSAYEACRSLADKIKTWTGIPVSIGIGYTKTQAKLANKIAKKRGIEVYSFLNTDYLSIYSTIPIGWVWGIGPKTEKKLLELTINSVNKFVQLDDLDLKNRFSISIFRIKKELLGESCFPFSELKLQKSLVTSRSFSPLIVESWLLEEQITKFARNVGRKLRAKSLLTSHLTVYIRTSYYRKNDVFYKASFDTYFSSPTYSDRDIIRKALICLNEIFKPGLNYAKAGIIVSKLESSNKKYVSQSLFKNASTETDLSQSIDFINSKYGKGTIW
jgi:DNA polymerase V